MAFTQKLLYTVPFQCTKTACPKNRDTYPPNLLHRVGKGLSPNFLREGCQQQRTTVYGLSESSMSEDSWESTPFIGVILPSPDPDGAYGIGNFIGYSRDIITQSIWATYGKPVRVAIFFLTRGYSFEKVFKGEFQPSPIKLAAISACHEYLKTDIERLKPHKLLVCGNEVGNAFFPRYFNLPDYRRTPGHKIRIGDTEYPAQVTWDPKQCIMNHPAYLKSIREDIAKLFSETPKSLATGGTRVLRKLDEVLEYFDFMSEYPGYIAFDTETANLNRRAANALGTLQFSTDSKTGIVIPYEHRESPFDPFELSVIKARAKQFFRFPIKSKGILAHYSMFEHLVTKNKFGTFMRCAPVLDTLAAAYLEDETRSERKADQIKGQGAYTLKLLARDKLGFSGYDQGVLANRTAGTLMDLPLDELAVYGAMDTWVTHALFTQVLKDAEAIGYKDQLLRLLTEFYSPLTRLIAHIEWHGLKTDLKHLRNLKSKRGPFEQRIETLEAKLMAFPAFIDANTEVAKQKNAGNPRGVKGTVPWVLDFNKPDHARLVFMQIMGLDPVSFGEKSNVPSIDEDFFEAYREQHKEVDLYAQMKETMNMRNTFVNAIIERVDPQTGDPDCKLDQRIRPTINYAKLVTGRLSESKPNLHAVPKGEEIEDDDVVDESELVRKAVKDSYTVEKDCGFIQADYRVNEVRWAGILAWEPKLAEVFRHAYDLEKKARTSENIELLKEAALYADVHKLTASIMFGIPVEQVTKRQRKISKTLTFAILYGSAVASVAVQLELSEEATAELFAKFFANMPSVKKWLDLVKATMKRQGFYEAPHGRRRRLWGYSMPESYSRYSGQVARCDRQAANSPIQGIASDGSMLGVTLLLEYIEEHEKNWVIMNVIHDSALVQVPKAEIAEFIMVSESILVEATMKKMDEQLGVKFNIPLAIDIEVGIRWGSLSKWSGTKTNAFELQKMVEDYWEKAA